MAIWYLRFAVAAYCLSLFWAEAAVVDVLRTFADTDDPSVTFVATWICAAEGGDARSTDVGRLRKSAVDEGARPTEVRGTRTWAIDTGARLTGVRGLGSWATGGGARLTELPVILG